MATGIARFSGIGDGLTDKVIERACSMAMDAHKHPEKLYLFEEATSLDAVIFSFPGHGSVNDWFTRDPFGEKKIDVADFPSLKSIATEEVATVNEAFQKRFQKILPEIKKEVEKFMRERKKIVFKGHSSGGPVAILVTVWFLQEEFKRKRDPKDRLSPLCITFGSPFIGDRIFNHALNREKWLGCFTHFVMRYDIVPRLLFAPLSSIKKGLKDIPDFLKPTSKLLNQDSSAEVSILYENVMTDVSSLASTAACNLMENGNNFSETLSKFVKLSPYIPFGTYVFCTEEELVVEKNPDAVLQILFYASQSLSKEDRPGIAMRSIKDHHNYGSKLQSLEKKNFIHLDSLEELPLSSDCIDVENDKVLNHLGLSTRARLCLSAAKELQKRKLRNQERFDKEKKNIEVRISRLENYKASSVNRKLSYYDTFKLSTKRDDFLANVESLELAGIFDELMEMIKRYELPDGFEVDEYWIDILTRHRCLVEPLDISNFYRHGRNFDSKTKTKSKPYMKDGRPKRYRYPQKWLEYTKRMEAESLPESCFWAEVEELDVCLKDRKNSNEELSGEVKERISLLEKKVEAWVRARKLSHDIFFQGSTFMKCWESLPQQYRLESSFSGFISEQQNALERV